MKNSKSIFTLRGRDLFIGVTASRMTGINSIIITKNIENATTTRHPK